MVFANHGYSFLPTYTAPPPPPRTSPQPTPHPILFFTFELTRRANQTRVVTEPKQPGVHNYSEKGGKFGGRQKNSLSFKQLNQLAQCYDERF